MTASTRETLEGARDAAPRDGSTAGARPLRGTFSLAAGGGGRASYEITVTPGRTALRLDGDFMIAETSDVMVALSPAVGMPARGALVLGKLTRQVGRQTFVIHPRADLSAFTHVVLWCEACGRVLGSAALERE
jgi:hypothetical protein